jgi:L-iditol 2-dehydrogenase
MKALVFTAPHELIYRDEPDPTPVNDEVIVRIDACGICGSDMHPYHGHGLELRPPPLVLGHEAAGVVSTGVRAGQRVALNPAITCGTCDNCLDGRDFLCRSFQLISRAPRNGAFADMVRIPESSLVAVPDGFDIVKAALAEPLSVGYHAVNLAVRHWRRPVAAARVAVLGGGAIGICTALAARLQGMHGMLIAEPHAGRRRTAERAGDFRAYEPGSAAEPKAEQIDIVFDAVGNDATRAAASRMVAPGGVIVHIGLLPGSGGLDPRKFTLREVAFVGSIGYSMLEFRETMAALVAGRLGDLSWYETRPMKDGHRAFQDIDAGRTDFAKIILVN